MILYIHKRDEGDDNMLKNEKLLKKEISELLEEAKSDVSTEVWESARELADCLLINLLKKKSETVQLKSLWKF